MNFIAIDFETANSARDSACALGLVVVEDGAIVERKYTLINPRVPFHRFCTYVHGINASSVVASPAFEDIYPVFYQLIHNKNVFAHNASFDIAVLTSSCESRDLPMASITPYCSVEMSRMAWPELTHHRLNALCEHFSLPLKHHNAVEDATACAMIVLKAAEQYKKDTPAELMQFLQEKARMDAKKRKKEETALKKKLEQARNELQG